MLIESLLLTLYYGKACSSSKGDRVAILIDIIYSVKVQQFMTNKQCRFNMRVMLLRITHESTPKYTYFQCGP